MEPGSQVVGVVARLEPEKGHQTLIDAWPHVLRDVPDAYLLVVGEGVGATGSRQRAAANRVAHRVVFTGRRDDVPAVTAALDVAVLPSHREAQGLCDPRGDGAVAAGRRVRRRRHPRDDRGRRHRACSCPHDRPEALAAAIVRLLSDHALADTIARAGHDLVHDRFCIELMVRAIEEIYDEGARRARRPRVAAG